MHVISKIAAKAIFAAILALSSAQFSIAAEAQAPAPANKNAVPSAIKEKPSSQPKKKNAKPQTKPSQGNKAEALKKTEAIKAALTSLRQKNDFYDELAQASKDNGRWQWVYRDRAIESMREASNNADETDLRVFESELGLNQGGVSELNSGALMLIKELEANGNAIDAALLKAIMQVYLKNSGAQGLENMIRTHTGSRFSGLGRFVLGIYNERNGFFPEAMGHYTLSAGEKDTLLAAASPYKNGRLYFFRGKLDKAKELFQLSSDMGYGQAKLWLANVLFLKGSLNQAWDIYSVNNPDLATDPVILSSMADIRIIMGNFSDARRIYERLRLNQKNEFLASYFELRKGDSHFAQGNKDEAIDIYASTKGKLKGEEWAMASLALADALSTFTDFESLDKAMDIYEALGNGDFLGSDDATLRLGWMQTKSRKYDAAIDTLARFHTKYPLSPLRERATELFNKTVYLWVDKLYNEKDFYAIAKLKEKYGQAIPFGKKAETYLKSGRAYDELSLSPEAVAELNAAVRLGAEEVAEEAMITLGRVYLKQGDPEAVERLMKNFITRFPKSVHMEDVNVMLMRASFMKGDYNSVVSADYKGGDPEIIAMTALSYEKLLKMKEAREAYAKAAAIYAGKGDSHAAARAYIGMADALFVSGDFMDSINGYRLAAGYLEDGEKDKSWALYRMVQGYSNLKMEGEARKTLNELKAFNDEYGVWAESMLKEAPLPL